MYCFLITYFKVPIEPTVPTFQHPAIVQKKSTTFSTTTASTLLAINFWEKPVGKTVNLGATLPEKGNLSSRVCLLIFFSGCFFQRDHVTFDANREIKQPLDKVWEYCESRDSVEYNKCFSLLNAISIELGLLGRWVGLTFSLSVQFSFIFPLPEGLSNLSAVMQIGWSVLWQTKPIYGVAFASRKCYIERKKPHPLKSNLVSSLSLKNELGK